MTDNVDITIDNMVNQVDSGLNQQSNAVSTSSEATAPSAGHEGMVPKSKVNELIKASFGRGIEKGRSETSQQSTNVSPQPQVTSGVSEEYINALVEKKLVADQEKYIASQQQAEFTQMISSLRAKVADGQQKYEDFDKIVAPLNITSEALQHLLPVWNNLENPADILYELGKNRGKWGQLLNFAYNPSLFLSEAQAIGAAIKQNEKATNQPSPRDPINPLTPSNLGMDNGRSSLRDERLRYRV